MQNLSEALHRHLFLVFYYRRPRAHNTTAHACLRAVRARRATCFLRAHQRAFLHHLTAAVSFVQRTHTFCPCERAAATWGSFCATCIDFEPTAHPAPHAYLLSHTHDCHCIFFTILYIHVYFCKCNLLFSHTHCWPGFFSQLLIFLITIFLFTF